LLILNIILLIQVSYVLENYYIMEKSILDQIINNQKIEEIAKLNTVDIVNNLFNELNDREKDILSRRFGLGGNSRETLETVGTIHNLTRERIRQIEVGSIKKIRQLKNLNDYLDIFKKVINQLLEEHGGLIEREYLLNLLVNFSFEGESGQERTDVMHKNNIDFLISKLMDSEFEELAGQKFFKDSYKLKYQSLEHLESLAEEMFLKIQEPKKILKTEELINLLTKSEVYNKNSEKFNANCNIDISNVLANDFFDEPLDIINNNKILYSLLRSLKKVDQNKFGHWGINNWREIKPKTINDKIYLVLKDHGKPMHFTEIANRINEVNFDNKKANAATVHNELILDKKYILIGRGLYSLREWGYEKGTVVDVIIDVLSGVDGYVSRDEIINKVLEKRIVKKTTIILALMNKEIFKKVSGGYVLEARSEK